MKLKLLVFTLVLFPAFMFGQQGTRTNCLYNKGKMVVKGTGTSQTVLYVGGDFIAGTDATDNDITSEIVIDNSKVRITGDLVNNVENKTVFVKPSYSGYTAGVFEFRPLSTSVTAQRIYSDKVSNVVLGNRKDSYIDFPGLQIANSAHVTADPAIAMKTGNLILEEGWLVLDSRRTVDDDIDPSIIDQDIRDAIKKTKTVTAHLQVTGNTDYRNKNNADYNKVGMVQVNMQLDENPQSFTYKSLVGFGIPFKKMYPDYFMWNHVFPFLKVGSNNGPATGDLASPQRNPEIALEAGRGYALGVDLRGPDAQYYKDHEFSPINSFAQRAQSDYYFNRYKYANDASRNSNQIFGTHTSPALKTDAFTAEEINTQDVEVTLHLGYNHLSNPFTAPLDVSDLLVSSTSANSDWGVIIGNDKSQASIDARHIRNRVWILNGSTTQAKYHFIDGNYVDYSLGYYIAKETGSTYMDEDGTVTIPPQQLFMVYVEKLPPGGKIKIPAKKQVMANSLFIRSTDDKEEKRDDFVFEVIDAETKTSDRVSVVLRTAEEISENGEYSNVRRIETKNSQATDDDLKNKATINDDGVNQSVANQIYTKDDNITNEFRALTVKYLPIQEGVSTSTELYMKPSSVSQKIALRGLRMNTKDRVKQVVLEDTKNNRMQDLSNGELYVTTSEPNDRSNRFILHFYASPLSIGDDNASDNILNAYYAYDAINVTGFSEVDFGSTITIFDMQGRILKSVQVDNYRMVIEGQFSSGVYVVKVSGNKSYVKKILVNK